MGEKPSRRAKHRRAALILQLRIGRNHDGGESRGSACAVPGRRASKKPVSRISLKIGFIPPTTEIADP
jgi:hypothetical protein